MFMLEGMTPTVKVYPCRVRTVAESLDGSDLKIYMDAMSNSAAWTNNGLARALTDRGLKISETSIRTHRRGECSCA
jgi:hypothetical protein